MPRAEGVQVCLYVSSALVDGAQPRAEDLQAHQHDAELGVEALGVVQQLHRVEVGEDEVLDGGDWVSAGRLLLLGVEVVVDEDGQLDGLVRFGSGRGRSLPPPSPPLEERAAAPWFHFFVLFLDVVKVFDITCVRQCICMEIS